MVDQDSADGMMGLYESNNVIDENGNVTVDSVPDGMRYIIITGREDNGVPTVLQAAVNNDKNPKYDVDEMLCVVKGKQGLNFKLVGGCIRLQGTSSLAYPIKNYRIYMKNASKVEGQLYLGCNEQGVGGALQEKAKYSFRPAGGGQKQAAPVDCFCLKADFAESSSSHNTGMARLVQNVLTEAGELTPAQRHVSEEYQYDVRTTIDGEHATCSIAVLWTRLRSFWASSTSTTTRVRRTCSVFWTYRAIMTRHGLRTSSEGRIRPSAGSS
jgi:hypothetical protein